MSQHDNPVYSQQVIDFGRVALEYCNFIENTDAVGLLKDWITKAHLILPELYLRAVNLPKLTPAFEELNQRSVNENDYNLVLKKMLVKLGEFDSYEEVFNPNRIEAENSVGESISENLADIYQDIKDFILLFEDGSYEVMYEAVWEVQQSFEQYWGQKLTNTLRALHYLKYSENEIDEMNETDGIQQDSANLDDIDTSNWIISKRQEDFRNNE